jgi:hypothetical protein
VVTTAGFAALLFLTESWGYGLFVLPLATVAVGMGLANGCASAAATASVPEREVGAASGISNMARYIGASLFVAASATLYGAASSAGTPVEVANGVTRNAVLMTVVSGVGIALALCYGHHRPPATRVAGRTAAAVHTITSPAPARRHGSVPG